MVNAQEWLDLNYPYEERGRIEKLNISYGELKEKGILNENEYLDGSLSLIGFANLKELNCSEQKKITNFVINNCPKFTKIILNHNDELTVLEIVDCPQLTCLELKNNNSMSFNINFSLSQNKENIEKLQEENRQLITQSSEVIGKILEEADKYKSELREKVIELKKLVEEEGNEKYKENKLTELLQEEFLESLEYLKEIMEECCLRIEDSKDAMKKIADASKPSLVRAIGKGMSDAIVPFSGTVATNLIATYRRKKRIKDSLPVFKSEEEQWKYFRSQLAWLRSHYGARLDEEEKKLVVVYNPNNNNNNDDGYTKRATGAIIGKVFEKSEVGETLKGSFEEAYEFAVEVITDQF